MFAKIKASVKSRALARAAALIGPHFRTSIDPCGPTLFGWKYATFGQLAPGGLVVNWTGSVRRVDGRDAFYNGCRRLWRLAKDARHYTIGIDRTPQGWRLYLKDNRPTMAEFITGLLMDAVHGRPPA